MKLSEVKCMKCGQVARYLVRFPGRFQPYCAVHNPAGIARHPTGWKSAIGPHCGPENLAKISGISTHSSECVGEMPIPHIVNFNLILQFGRVD